VDIPFLVAAYSVSCEETQYKAHYILAIFCVCFYVIGYPIFILFNVIFHINKLREEYDPVALQSGNVNPNLQKFYFFVAGYKKRYALLFWDLLVCIRKALQMAIFMFAADTDQQTLYSVLMLIMLIGHILAQPYSREHLNYLEQMSMAILLVANLIGGVFPVDETNVLANALSAVIVTGAIGLMAVFLFGYVAFHSVHDIIKKVRELSQKKSKGGNRYKFGFDSYDVLENWHRSVLSASATGEIFQFVTAVRNAKNDHAEIEKELDRLDELAIRGDPRLSAIISVYKKHPKIRQLERRLSMLLGDPLRLRESRGDLDERSSMRKSSAAASKSRMTSQRSKRIRSALGVKPHARTSRHEDELSVA
jgi:hypothetical protein